MSTTHGAVPADGQATPTDGQQATPTELASQYRALRDAVGAFELPRDVLRLAGPDAITYLQGQISQNVTPVAVGSSVDSLLLAPDGKLVATLRVTRTAEDAFVLDCDGGTGEAVAARLGRFKLRSKFDIEPLPWSCVALRGPRSADVLGLTAGQVTGPAPQGTEGAGTALVLPVGGSWAGFDLVGPAPAAPDGVERCGRDAWEACRIEEGIPLMGAELDERTIPAEAHLVEGRVDFTKGCYTGQELVARLDSRGNRVARRLCGLVLDAGIDNPGGLLGAALVGPDGVKEVGRITSAAFSPGLRAVVALAYVHRSVEIGGTVTVAVTGTAGAAARPAQVRELPLV